MDRDDCFQNESKEKIGLCRRLEWVNANGDIYYKISPVFMPMDADSIGRSGTMPMYLDSTMWNAVGNWFNGGSVAATNFNAHKWGDIFEQI